jgi:hypothetical protein
MNLYKAVMAWGLRLKDEYPRHRILRGGDFQTATQLGTCHGALSYVLAKHLIALHPHIPTFPPITMLALASRCLVFM